MKKVFAILLSVMLAFSFTAAALAASVDPGDQNTGTEHTYKAYKIFEGYQGTATTDLIRINWGNGVDGTAFLTELKNDADFASFFAGSNTAADVAAVIGGTEETRWDDNSDNAKHFAELAYKHIAGGGIPVENGATELDAGYYLVVDVTVFPDGATGEVRNLALLQQTRKGTFEINVKVEAPTVQKKVKDINDSTETELSGWQDSADHDIGDDIPFQLTATLKDISMFESYKLVFNDTGCAGLAPDTDSFKLYIDNKEVTKDNAFDVDVNGNNFTVTIADVIALGAESNSVVSVEYEAELTASATIGPQGNPNEVYLEYSNNPNYDSTVPGQSEEMGKTVKDKVIVFTYKVNIDKYENDAQGNEKPLQGAGFTLYKLTPNATQDTETIDEKVYTKIGEKAAGTETSFEWKGIDDGEYLLVESVVPNGYARMENLTFTVSAEHNTEADDPELTAFDCGNAFTGDVDTGVVYAKIFNTANGALLPETGGIGTKIFYIVGGIMLAGAAILLITKRRMKLESC